jgi:lipopolysaccharide/colanic/teichoic acid biosynthesis glycosyltransferase
MGSERESEQAGIRIAAAIAASHVGQDLDVPFEIKSGVLYSVSKRMFDILLSLLALVLLVPIIPLIAVMIKLDTPGPVFFRQERVGRKGRIFRFYKFRSMFVGAETRRKDVEALNEQDGPVFKLRSDPRVTNVGRFLRRSSLDEIPQIFNVVRGEMSVVGPRPPLPSEVEHYQQWHWRRLEVTPGITCFWQISGRSHLSFNEWMRLDMEYLKHRGFKTDLLIFLKTIPAVIARKGAY